MLAGCCLLSAGCKRQAAIPDDSFHLTVENVITDRDIVVSLLRVHVPHNSMISLNSEYSHSMVTLAESSGDAPRDGEVALTASRITRQGDKFAYIQTFMGTKPNGGAGLTGGASTHPVPATMTLDTYFTVFAKDGDYKLGQTIEIAKLDGKPVTLVVGKPPK